MGIMLYYNITGVYLRRFSRFSTSKTGKSTSRAARATAGFHVR
jgi:hypothetical protein